MDNEQYILFHRYSIIGKQYAEKITEEERITGSVNLVFEDFNT